MEASSLPLAILDFFSGPEMLLVLAIALIFFGGDKMPDVARGLAKGIREFKKATGEVEREFKRVMEEAENPPPPPTTRPPTVLPAPGAAAYNPHFETLPAPATPEPPAEEAPAEGHSDSSPAKSRLEGPESGPDVGHLDV
jgi:sec-independent protein translocase protein TatA